MTKDITPLAESAFNNANKESIAQAGRTKGRSTMLSELGLCLRDCNDGFKKRMGFRFMLSGHKNGGAVSFFKSLAEVDDHLRKLWVVRRWTD